MKLKLIICGCILLMMPAILFSTPRLYSSWTGYPIPEHQVLGFHYSSVHFTDDGMSWGNASGMVYPWPADGYNYIAYKYCGPSVSYIFPYNGSPHAHYNEAFGDRYLLSGSPQGVDWAGFNKGMKAARLKGNYIDMHTIRQNDSTGNTLPGMDINDYFRIMTGYLSYSAGIYCDLMYTLGQVGNWYNILNNETRIGQKYTFFDEYDNFPYFNTRHATTCGYQAYCSPPTGGNHHQLVYRGNQVTGESYYYANRYCFFWNNYTPCIESAFSGFALPWNFQLGRKAVILDHIDATGPHVPAGIGAGFNYQVNPAAGSVTLYGGTHVFIGLPDEKYVYNFFRNVHVGELFVMAGELSTRWVSCRINGDGRTQTTRDGSGVHVFGYIRSWSDSFFGDEDLCIVNYTKKLEVGRSSNLGFDININKQYTENLIVKVEFVRGGVTSFRRATVINQKVKVNLGELFGITQIADTDIIRFKLYKEVPMDDTGQLIDGNYWDIHHFAVDEVILNGSELGIGAEIIKYPKSIKRGVTTQINAKITNYSATAKNGVQINWTLPAGWSVVSGSMTSTMNIGASTGTIVSFQVIAGTSAVFGIQRFRIKANMNQEIEGVEVNCGMDSKMGFVDEGTYWDTSYSRIPAGIETDGWKGYNPLTGVTIPLSLSIDLGDSLSGGTYLDLNSIKVYEYDTSGNIIQSTITCQFNKADNFISSSNVTGEVVWLVNAGNNYRNFYVYYKSIDTDNSASYTVPEPLFNGRNITLTAGQVKSTTNKFAFCSLEMKMKFGTGGTNNTKVGWNEAGSNSYFIWNYTGTQLDGHFDNGSDQPEYCTGRMVQCPNGSIKNVYSMFGIKTGDPNLPGDFGWPAGGNIISQYNATANQYHTYTIEWRRTFQQWLIDKTLVYERELVLPYQKPLLVSNNASSLDIAYIKINSVYARPAVDSYTQYKIAVTANPGSINADGMSISTITAKIQDRNGNIITSAFYDQMPVTFSITGQGTWDDDTQDSKPCTLVNGIATTRIKSKTMPGTVTIQATVSGWVPGTLSFDTIPMIPAKVVSNSNPANITADGVSISTITAEVKDVYNNVVYIATNTVTFSITGEGTWSDGSVGESMVASIMGVATISLRSTKKTGAIKVNADSYNLAGSSTTVTTTPGPVKKLRYKIY